jgi:hypothetical protein
MADEHEDVFEVEEVEEDEEVEEAVPQELAEGDEDLVAHPDWKWIAREPRRMGTKLGVSKAAGFSIRNVR